MDAKQLKEDVRSGQISPERLVDLLISQSRELERAKARIEELERKIGGPTQRLEEPYSVRSEEARKEAKQRKKRLKKKDGRSRRGRVSTAEKLKLAARTEKVFPEGVARKDCKLSHTRPVWRFENGSAVLVAYEVYRGPQKQYGKIPGVLGRSEYGIEISITIAYLVYVVGLSFDKVCQLLNFFQDLKLRKSQADALLHRLSRAWESEFEVLCTLLANSAVVHSDETSWSINSVWAFLSEKARVLFYGVHKDAATLQQILDPACFEGLVVSDDAAVYGHFTNSQKCWAHLLRKAIKLTLLAPENEAYRLLTDRLLEIYREACRVQRDRRLSDAGRARKVALLDDQVLELCGPVWFAELSPSEGPDNDHRLLCNELMRLMLAQELFSFVLTAAVETPNGESQPVAGTNNESERTLRGPAQARVTGRTNKTSRGARRQTVVTSIFESLSLYLAKFNLSAVIAEVQSWQDRASCFAKLLAKLKIPLPDHSALNKLLPLLQPS